MATIDISATIRTETGKGPTRKLRSTGQIPATIYRGGNDATLLSMDPRNLILGFDRTKNPNTLVNVNFGDDSKLCLVKEVQRHPVSGNIRHIDFYNVSDEEAIEIVVPIQLTGKSVGVAQGGKIRVIKRNMRLSCRPNDIPEAIMIDVTHLDVGEFFKASEVVPPTNCKLIIPTDFNILTVIRRRGSE